MKRELVLEFDGVRLPGPGRQSGQGDWIWQVVHSDRVVEATCLLCPRGDIGSADVLPVVELSGPIRELASCLGWPTEIVSDRSIQSMINNRSNDYWLIDEAVKLVDPAEARAGGISVVIPARNSQATIEPVLTALATALEAQEQWECIVVDDASDTPLVAGGPGVRVIRSDKRLSCGGARNFGLDEAKYDTVMFCDSDTLVPPDYFAAHLPVQHVAPNVITVSMRDVWDERVSMLFTPEWKGLVPVPEPTLVRSLAETDDWRDFGYGRLLGPIGLQFMVHGHNIVTTTDTARQARFPPDYVGWGPEDNAFAAKCIAQGCFIRPVLGTPVRHLPHPPRSGSVQQQERELMANLVRYERDLASRVAAPWPEP